MNPNGLEVPVRPCRALGVDDVLVVYVDIFAFYKPGTVRDILRGRVWEFEINQGWALGVLALMTIPSVMIALSVLLPTRRTSGPTSSWRPCSSWCRSATRWARPGPSSGSARSSRSWLLATVVRLAWRWRAGCA
jgi:hypothetical protein